MSGIVGSAGSKSGVIISGSINTFAQAFKLTSTFSGGTGAMTGWTAQEKYSPNNLTMSDSSGTWTYPRTGMYEIYFQITSPFAGDQRYLECNIMTTGDNFSAQVAHYGYLCQMSNGTSYLTTKVLCFHDVTNTSTHQVRLGLASAAVCTAAANDTFCLFKRIGDA